MAFATLKWFLLSQKNSPKSFQCVGFTVVQSLDQIQSYCLLAPAIPKRVKLRLNNNSKMIFFFTLLSQR